MKPQPKNRANVTSDDREDIKTGVATLKRALQSIQTARRAVENISDSHDQRDAAIALTHAEEMAGIAERMFRTVINGYASCPAEDLEG